jgi:hypothetical protein
VPGLTQGTGAGDRTVPGLRLPTTRPLPIGSDVTALGFDSGPLSFFRHASNAILGVVALHAGCLRLGAEVRPGSFLKACIDPSYAYVNPPGCVPGPSPAPYPVTVCNVLGPTETHRRGTGHGARRDRAPQGDP